MKHALFTLVLAAVSGAVTCARAQTQDPPPPTPQASPAQAPLIVSDPVAGWSLTLPAGWQMIRPDLLEAANQTARRLSPNEQFTFTHGFTTDPQGSLVYPYVLVQRTKMPLESADYADLERVLSQASMQTGIEKIEEATGGSVRGFVPGQAVFDRERAVAYFDLDVAIPDGAAARARCWMFFATDGITQLNCYDAADHFEQSLPQFESLAASFSFAPHRGYRPVAPGSASAVGRRVLTGVLIGVGCGVAFILFRKAAARKQA